MRLSPTGNYAIIKGQEGETNPEFLREGMAEILDPLIASGDITIPDGAEVYTDDWEPENAQDNMETILTATNNDIQAVLSENDGMAGGAVSAALGPGPRWRGGQIGGQDGDMAALNRVALGTQVVSVLKDATELGTAAGEAALQLCADPDISKVTGAEASTTTGGLEHLRRAARAAADHAGQPPGSPSTAMADRGRALRGRPSRRRSTGCP